MKVFSKRNALLGFLSWRIGKRVVGRRARRLTSGSAGGTRRKPTVLALLAAVGGAVFFWRTRRRAEADEAVADGQESESPGGEVADGENAELP